ncbi:MAG: TetR/AcrR family transcriptional regulator [Deltaproteobacteria bacterium]|nr:TetR/AcrR family transcriptional regulator [Deltaproteobacteria bacterium]
MRYAPGHNEATRNRIVEISSRLFREEGIAAVGLAKVMAKAGLTVGTFYTHFKSKDALVREALLRTLDTRHEGLAHALEGADVESVVRSYLSPEHRDDAGRGCAVAALVAEVARHPRATRQTFAAHNAPTVEALAAWLSRLRGKKVGAADAAAFLGLLAGTLQLARATPDRAESDAILEAGVRAAIRLAT